jgi:hypothetical protein
VELDDDRNCAAKLNSLCAVLRVSLGEVCHRQNDYVTAGGRLADYESTCPDSRPARVTDRG